MRERTIADSRRIALQGLQVGETVVTAPFHVPEEAAGVYVMFLKTALCSMKDTWSFPVACLVDWAKEIDDLHVVVVLPSAEDESVQSELQTALGSRGCVLLDDTGQLFSMFQVEEEAPMVGFLVDSKGSVVSRVPPLRLTTAQVIREHITSWYQGTRSSDTTRAFGATHPSSTDPSIRQALGVVSEEASWTDEDLPILVYVFAPDCGPCEYTSEVAVELADSFSGKLNLIGLASLLSSECIASVATYSRQYAGALNSNQKDWAESLLVHQQDPNDLVEAAQELSDAFPVIIDWDQTLAGELGLALASLPCWALYDSGGRFVDLLPGGMETVYVDGVPHEGALPPLEYLQRHLDGLLAELST